VTVYNHGGFLRILGLITTIFAIAFSSIMIFVPIIDPNLELYIVPGFIAGILTSLYVVSISRDGLCIFVIDEKGVTSKLPFRNILITWDEMCYIGVGKRRYGLEDVYQICFSKVFLEKVPYFGSHRPVRQTKKKFFVRYREGMLDEILKYVDESRINNLRELKDDPYQDL